MPDAAQTPTPDAPRARLASLSGLDRVRGMRDGTLPGPPIGETLGFRIAEAMDELGATTRFELGVRWAGRRDRASRPTPTPSR